MRPQSAVNLRPNIRVQQNQQTSQIFYLNQQGKEIKVNKIGELIPKFDINFTGVVNYKQRKIKGQKNRTFMYTVPNLEYQKQSGFICPTGTKMNGYMQFPYNLKGKYPQHLNSETFKQSIQVKNNEKGLDMRTKNTKSCTTFQNQQIKNSLVNNRFKSLKKLRKPQSRNFSLLEERNYGIIPLGTQNYKIDQDSQKYKGQQNKTQKQQELESIILIKGSKYANQKVKNKDYHYKTNSTFHTSGNEDQCQIQPDKSLKKSTKSYFNLSLNNIQRTFNSNSVYGNFYQGQIQNSPYQNSCNNNWINTKNTFNSQSTYKKCYNNSCHDINKYSYSKYLKKPNQQTITINSFNNELQLLSRQTNIVSVIKEKMMKYQPALTTPTVQQQTKIINKKQIKKAL